MMSEIKISFRSGGFFFWWQAGVLMSLQKYAPEKMKHAQFHGCSAGSIVAALASCRVNMDLAKSKALELAEKNNLWKSNIKMISEISDSIRTFLNDLLPRNAVSICQDRLVIYATKVDFCSCPIMTRSALQNFKTKKDIIEACLASIHVPFLLNGRIFSSFHGQRYIDGCLFWSPITNAINIDYDKDQKLKEKKWSIFQNFTKQDFLDMIVLGENYGDKLRQEIVFY